MKRLIKFFIIYILSFFLLNKVLQILVPAVKIDSTFNFVATILLIFVVFNLNYDFSIQKKGNIRTVSIILAVLFVYFIIGSINYYIVKFVYPTYEGNITKTHLYFLFYVIFLMIGYKLYFKLFGGTKTSIIMGFQINKTLYLMMLLGAVGTVIGVLEIGFIPSFVSGAGNERYFSQIDFLSLRLWHLNLIVSYISFGYYIQSKKKKYLLFSIISIIQLGFFVVRFNILLAVLGNLLIFLKNKKIQLKHTIWGIIGIILFLVFNGLFLKQREGVTNALEAKASNKLSTFQTRYIYKTFNEYRQLNVLINNYDKKEFGSTFLSVPISFLPYYIWDLMGVDKRLIKEKNSALLFAEEIGGKGGIRTGLAGELWINFNEFGPLFMLVIGLLLGVLERRYKQLNHFDIRYYFIIALISTLIYMITVGQIDMIGSQLSILLYIYIFVSLFTKKYRIRNTNSNYHHNR